MRGHPSAWPAARTHPLRRCRRSGPSCPCIPTLACTHPPHRPEKMAPSHQPTSVAEEHMWLMPTTDCGQRSDSRRDPPPSVVQL